MSPRNHSPLPWTSDSTVRTDWTLHQLAPYIGRMKTTMARALISALTKPGDLVVDPFCGSGVVPLEAAASGRCVLAGDWNPYAVVLTRAKLFPPKNFGSALRRFEATWTLSRSLVRSQDLRSVPWWVRSFFHPDTLRNALAFRDACALRGETFLLACLLGILHHQRSGFLSYPSSHLVPYLRNKKFPRDVFPDLYKERDVRERMLAKILRTYRRIPPQASIKSRVVLSDARRFPKVNDVQAVITSPPYMNELDYVRDNRLRLWFINRLLPSGNEAIKRNKETEFVRLLDHTCCRLGRMIRPGGFFALVLGEASRGGKPTDTAALAQRVFREHSDLQCFSLLRIYNDRIPDIRRSRRECKGTKAETVLIYRREVD